MEDKRQRDLSSRSLSVRGVWDRAVDAWLDDDVEELDDIWDDIWDDIIQDLGSARRNTPPRHWSCRGRCVLHRSRRWGAGL
ncbi:hypothetical protein [Streptomyces sp. NBC_01341]|uniref:hypothetical protein n=1 Tax=Streptomyces sp. NBC_01341 TaxID=2903831 RepID=UPI002E166EAC